MKPFEGLIANIIEKNIKIFLFTPKESKLFITKRWAPESIRIWANAIDADES
jgi:hypothetical protein